MAQNNDLRNALASAFETEIQSKPKSLAADHAQLDSDSPDFQDFSDDQALPGDDRQNPDREFVRKLMKMAEMDKERQAAARAADEARRRKVPIELPPEPAEEASELGKP